MNWQDSVGARALATRLLQRLSGHPVGAPLEVHYGALWRRLGLEGQVEWERTPDADPMAYEMRYRGAVVRTSHATGGWLTLGSLAAEEPPPELLASVTLLLSTGAVQVLEVGP